MTQGLIFDLRRYSIHDGPGIRTTVFFKGCPLRCRWCHNPEGQSFDPELMLRSHRCLKECSECLAACEAGALSKRGGAPVLDRRKCTVCGRCAFLCPTQALAVVGRRVSASEVMAEVEKDRIFYEQSGGGVTFSGGEPLAQPEFLAELLDESQRRGFHTAVDTCGHVPKETIETISGLADLFLFDLKVIDDSRHRKYTGRSNRPILENLRVLAERGRPLAIRLPIITGANDDEDNIARTAELLQPWKETIDRISLLPYHKLGREKSRHLEREESETEFEPPSAETITRIRHRFEEQGFRVSIGA